MNRAWVTKHRRALTTTAVAIGLILAGRFAHGNLTVRQATYGFVPVEWQFGWVSILRAMFAGILLLTVMWVAATFLGAARSVTGNGKASLGQGLIVSSILWVASDKAEFDWRALRITGMVLAGLLVASYLPMVVWENAQYAGYAILVGQVLGVFWVELFTEQPRWGTALGFLNAPEQTTTPERGDYWRDARSIRKGWDKLVQDLMAKMEDVGAKVKAPKLVGDPEVTERSISLVVEPPSMWTYKGLVQLAGGLTNEWSGQQSQVRVEKSDRMSKRRMRIDIAMMPLPESIPYPDGDTGYGVPIGVGMMGDVLRLEVGPRGVPHVLVAGQSGAGKSSAMRVMGLGMVARGADVRCIDPKGEGDLDGISHHPTMFDPAEWADWFDFLWDEQIRRATVKREGGDPGLPIVTMIDELMQIATKQGARDAAGAKRLDAAHKAYMRIIGIGRGSGLHIISATQQASAQNLGGDKQGTTIRAQHLGRVLLGRASETENRKMVLGDRLLTDQDIEKMQEAPPGRAWVSGMTPRDTGLVHCVQFFDVPEMAGGAGVPVLDRATPEPAPDGRETINAGSGEQDALRYLVADAVHTDGAQPRADLCTRFGVPVTTMRNALRKAEQAGWVKVESPGGNQPVVVHPVGAWPPSDRA